MFQLKVKARPMAGQVFIGEAPLRHSRIHALTIRGNGAPQHGRGSHTLARVYPPLTMVSAAWYFF
jgi:hypothetical protein